MIVREYAKTTKQYLWNNKAIILYGARQVGKTTYCKQLVAQYPDKKTLWLNGDDSIVRQELAPSLSYLRSILQGYDICVLDEAQRISDIGLIIKLIIDNIP